MARNFCKHYRGMHRKDVCEAGVVFKSLPMKTPDDCPCWNAAAGGCDKQEFPTAEEIAAEEAEINARFIRLGKARKAIVDHLGGPWKKGTPGARGVIDCPNCAGVKSLRFSRAGYNGHIHARCSTPNCCSWME